MKKIVYLFALLFAIGTTFVACSDEIIDSDILVTGVVLDYAMFEVIVGETHTLTPTIGPAGATNKNVTWETDNAAVATVSATGVVTGVTGGVTNITVSTIDGRYTATARATVIAFVDNITVEPTELALISGANYQLTFTITPIYASNQAVRWSSDNSSVAAVSATGMVTAGGDGEAIITATTVCGEHSATTTISVTAPPRFDHSNWTIHSFSNHMAPWHPVYAILTDQATGGGSYWHCDWNACRDLEDGFHFVVIDMQEALHITHVEILRRYNNTGTRGFIFCISSDGENFTQVGEAFGLTADNIQEFFVFSVEPTTGRYLRVRIPNMDGTRIQHAMVAKVRARGMMPE
jgi:hypothetical protein